MCINFSKIEYFLTAPWPSEAEGAIMGKLS
jgi:hypothetical protein